MSVHGLAASSPGLLLSGLDDTRFGPFVLPLPLFPLGMNGCFLRQDLVANAGFAASSKGEAAFGLTLPNLSLLVGVPLYFQVFTVSPRANAANALMTNGMAIIPR